MRTEEFDIKIASHEKEVALSTTPQSHRSWYAFLRSPLWMCLLLALGLRAWLIVHTQGFIDGDEALVGIQAQHILHGEWPVYYYGQPYMGSLEAYLIALLFALIGSSTWAMRAEPVLLSLVVVWLTWRLAGALAEQARLSVAARRWFMTISALFAAVPPLYDGIIELRTWGGHIETYVIMLALLLSALRLTQRWHAGAARRELTWRWAGIGFLVGLGLWVYPLVICAIIAAAIWIVGDCLVEMGGVRAYRYRVFGGQEGRGQPQGPLPTTPQPPAPTETGADLSKKPISERGRQGALMEAQQLRHDTTSVLQRLALAVAALPAGLLGFAPALVWGASHRWANILFLLSPGNNNSRDPSLLQLYPNRLALMKGTTLLYGKCIAPHVIGGALPNTHISDSLLQASVGITFVLVTFTCVITALFRRDATLLRIQRLATLPCLFAAVSAVIFCTTSISAAGLVFPCIRDEVGRYGAPLLLVLPYFFATLITAAYISLRERNELEAQSIEMSEGHDLGLTPTKGVTTFPPTGLRRLLGLTPTRGVTTFPPTGLRQHGGPDPHKGGHYISADSHRRLLGLTPTRGVTTFPVLSLRRLLGLTPTRGVTTFPPTGLRRLAQGMLIAFLVLYLGAYSYTYVSADAGYTFQSFACTIAPVHNEPIIAYMQQQHIKYAWGTMWIGNSITFKTQSSIIVADPRIVTAGSANRLPANLAAVQKAERASILAFARHDDAHPTLLQDLDAMGVKYELARFPAEPGFDVMVVTPDRTLSPFDAESLGAWPFGC